MIAARNFATSSFEACGPIIIPYPPLSFAAFLLTAGWMVLGVGATVQLVISLVTFATWGYLMLHFTRRVQLTRREARLQKLHLNPFL